MMEVDSMDPDIHPEEDKVKTMANIMATAPKLVIEVGWSYLMMKRRAKKCAKRFRRAMVEGGMPEDKAKYLADNYASELSARQLIRNLGLPGVDIRVKEK